MPGFEIASVGQKAPSRPKTSGTCGWQVTDQESAVQFNCWCSAHAAVTEVTEVIEVLCLFAVQYQQPFPALPKPDDAPGQPVPAAVCRRLCLMSRKSP